MSDINDLIITDRWIVSSRGRKNPTDQLKPYAFYVEKERSSQGTIDDVATLFLTNRECRFHCLMCDLWKNTTDFPVQEGAIPDQIEYALNRLPSARQIKLYNSGSFFDEKAVTGRDYRRISSLVEGFDRVIVESHPAFIGEKCLSFRDMLKPELEVAVGLETAEPVLLEKLNKKMTLSEFRTSISFLAANGIATRVFILLRPPFLNEEEGVSQAEKSLDFAFGCGAECCVVIPVRAGNGAMDDLKRKGYFTPPDIGSLERVLEYGIGLKAGRVFADVWDLQEFSSCDKCFEIRKARIVSMNLSQLPEEKIKCTCYTL